MKKAVKYNENILIYVSRGLQLFRLVLSAGSLLYKEAVLLRQLLLLILNMQGKSLAFSFDIAASYAEHLICASYAEQ